MRQAGYLAAAGIYALENHVERLKEDHTRARKLGETLEGLNYVKEVLPVDTNIVVFEVNDDVDHMAIIDQLTANNMHTVPFGPGQIRLVTHLDYTDEMLEESIRILTSIQ